VSSLNGRPHTIARPRTVTSNVILYRGIGVCLGNLSKCRISCEVCRVEEDLEVHHVVNDDLNAKESSKFPRPISSYQRTWKSVGSEVSQLRVQPTTGLNRAASIVANRLIAFIAVWLVGLLYKVLD
jgi:hypothetical protein